ncbi:hypothetical protein [Rurimicrobium arvi]|uniref:Secreted protein n=1 Tax=Rurimicrobium arvi TaxID=2049916 RepID=A0ABP8MLG7_9BACT
MNVRQTLYPFIVVALLLAVACHSSRPLTYEDNKVYNDDSTIEMKSVERKSKMPFDTSAPVPRRVPAEQSR